MAKPRDIVIAGAGLGGLTAALALAARGFSVTVLERTEQLSEIGAGIQLSPNVSEVFDSLGLDSALAAIACVPTAIDIHSGPTDRKISSVSLLPSSNHYRFPWRVIARAELQNILAEAANAHPNIDLRLGTTVVDFVAGGDELLLGTETRSGPTVLPAVALIAADGVHSQLRKKIAHTTPARPIGRTAWRATLPARLAEQIVPNMRIGLWLGPEAHLVHYPIADGRIVNIVAIVSEDWKGVGWSEPGDHYWLAQRFANWAQRPRRFIAAPAEWRKWAILATDPDGPWTDGRVAILGDAAHAMPPFLAQGAAMAIEDGVVLAACFSASPEDPAAAIRAYEAARKPRVTAVFNAALRTGERYQFSGTKAIVRDIVLRTAGQRLAFKNNDWIYGWKPDA